MSYHLTLSHVGVFVTDMPNPEKNRVESLIDTPWYVPQPCRIVADLSLPDDELWATIERTVRGMPGFKPAAEWRADIEKRIAQATASRRRAPERVEA